MQQSAEKPEVRDPDHSEPEHTLIREPSEAAQDLSPGIESKRFARARRRHLGNAETREGASNGDHNQDEADHTEPVFPGDEHHAPE